MIVFFTLKVFFSVVIILFSFKDDRGEPVCEQSTRLVNFGYQEKAVSKSQRKRLIQ